MSMSNIELAQAWLKGENSWQWSAVKFSVENNRSELASNGTLDGLWAGQFNNYPPKARLYREASSWLHIMQYAGKTAATARGLFVTVAVLADETGRTGLDDANDISFSLVKDGLGLVQTDYHGVDLVWNTPIGQGLRDMDGLAKKRDFVACLPMAGTILLESAKYFVDKIDEASEIMGENFALPLPGVSSGNIEPWLPSQPTT